MKKCFLTVGLILAVAMGFTACSTGEYSELECDSSDYQTQCVGPKSYTYCKSGQLISVVCGGERICKSDGNTVSCKDPVKPGHDNSIVKE